MIIIHIMVIINIIINIMINTMINIMLMINIDIMINVMAGPILQRSSIQPNGADDAESAAVLWRESPIQVMVIIIISFNHIMSQVPV